MQKLLLLYYVVKSTDYVPFEEAESLALREREGAVSGVVARVITTVRYMI